MKKTLSVLLAVAMIFTLCFATVGCGSSDEPATDEGGDAAVEEESFVLHFGSTQGTTHAWYRALENFKTKIAEDSNGTLEISDEFGGAWGSDYDNAEAVRNGTLDMYIGSTVGFDTVVTEIGFVNLPYLVTTYDQVDSLIYNGWIGEKVVDLGAANGFNVMGITDCDFRWISNSKRPIESAADIKGLKMRTPGTTMFLVFFEELGSIPSALAFTELPSALQQGVYDGQDNGPTLSYPNGLYQFNNYWTKSNHSFASAVVAVNPDKLAKMSENQQAVLQSCIDSYCDEIKTLLRQDVADMTQAIIDYGCEVIETTEQLDSDMRAAGQATWANEEATSTFDKEAMERIIANGGAE